MLINDKHYRAVWFEDGKVKMIDQPLLPHKFEIVEYSDYRDVAKAIKTMVIRGAPSIGAAGAYGMALASVQGEDLKEAAEVLSKTRPTAQDLFYGIEKVLKEVKSGKDAVKIADQIADDYADSCEKIGEYGAKLLKDGMRINTHCNAGWLATLDWGTALSPVYKAKRQGKDVFVFVDETRPRSQGSRLTAYELLEEGVDHAVIADNATGYFMKKGEIDMVIVGSDRIAINGDVANKIGTYARAVLAKENNIPFYVAAPIATIDQKSSSGDDIPIEERNSDEVLFACGYDEDTKAMKKVRIAPKGSKARNPAFDVTPAKYIKGIITEKGIFKPEELQGLFKK